MAKSKGRDGKRNTKYFHAHAAVSRRKLKVLRLQDNQAIWQDDLIVLKEMVFSFFCELYASEPCVPCSPHVCVFSSLNADD